MKNYNFLRTFLIVVLIVFNLQVSRCDEGMWWPHLIEKLNYAEMKKLGLKLTPEEIYSINKSSLKDAVVSIGGCTAEIISSQSLMLTNHHCGYGRIAALSTVEKDYLKNGFWAKSFEEELPCPGMYARFLIRIEDVTDKIMANYNPSMTEKEFQEMINKEGRRIADEAIQNTHYVAEVKGSLYNNEFYLFVYEQFNDVRLVGTPPSSIGNFGGDTDNWMWPRHTGDFCLFRIYATPEGKPADYSPANVPLRPKKYLPISLRGVKENDFVMILGYPGRTSRYITSYATEMAYKFVNPAIVKIRDKKLKIMSHYMKQSDATRIQYAARHAGTSNYWKYFIGQNRGINRLKLIDRKREEEVKFQQWAEKNNVEHYKNCLKNLEIVYKELPEYALVNTYLSECFWRGSEFISFASRFAKLYELLSKKDANKKEIEEVVNSLKGGIDSYFSSINMELEKEMFASMLEMYYKDVQAKYQPSFYGIINKKYKNDFRKYTEDIFKKSFLTNKEKVKNFLNKPSSKLKNDPLFSMYLDIQNLTNQVKEHINKYNLQIEENMRYYIKGLMEMDKNRTFYADANSTMRLTYGKVKGYTGSDAVTYNYYTTIDGLMAKENPDNEEFIVPEKLKELYKKKDFGHYADKDGILRTCFIADTDITGGNSGSPVINATGELVGLAFDGNWEAMSGDLKFEPELKRTIAVDIRYVVFIIDKFAEAENIVRELDLRL